ncbi:MAG: DNA polymerase III subunit beta [Pirellulaceae bacterium]|nr:DNA polymerase III subunit beta [Pirellulaceae bacterium]
MKITLDRAKFLSSFAAAASVAPQRSPKAILQNVKVEATDSKVTLVASDTEISIRVETEGCQVEKPGFTVLPVARFGSILKENRGEKIELELKESKLDVKGDGVHFELPVESADLFPVVDDWQSEKYHEMNIPLFKEMVRRTLFATDNESSRYALGGVLFELQDEKAIMVATDGRRLAKMESIAAAVEGHTTGEKMVIVPSRAMQTLERVLGASEGNIWIGTSENKIHFKADGVVLSALLVEGRFPAWKEVFQSSKENKLRADLTVGPFYSALRQAAIVSSDESRGIDFSFESGRLKMSASTSEIGNSEVELPVTYENEPVEITLDHRFVSDFLKVLGPESVAKISLQEDSRPAVFSAEDNYDYVVMPLSRS